MMTGCATIFTGVSDDIYFKSDPKGADIYIDGLKAGETPGTIRIKRQTFGYREVTIKLDGYESRTFILRKSFNGISLLNLIWGYGSIFNWVIDIATGSVNRYRPTMYNLDLDFKGVSAYNINVLPKDKYGRILIPIDSESITVVDEEQELTLIFN